jgi:methionine aminotransferase
VQIQSRLPDTGTSIFTVMSALAAEHGAINLSQGFPDFDIDPELIRLVNDAMLGGHNQYAPMPGLPALREAIAEVVLRTYNRDTNPQTEVTVTAGGTAALYAAITALVRPGDEVIIFDPSYDSYSPAVRLNGGTPVHLNLLPPAFGIPWQQVENAVNEKTRMIIVNTPHNPCGSVLSEDDMRRFGALCRAHDIILLSDEVYERIIFDGKQHHSVLSFPDMKDHAIAVFSFGKTFHVTGWKTGYLVASPELTKEIRKSHQFITFSVNTPMQHGIAAYLKESSRYTSLGQFYQTKRDFFLEQLKGSPFTALPCFGSYFQIVSFEGYSKESDHELATRLTREAGIASIPVSAFYRDGSDHHLLRFCFAKRNETLEAAGKILRTL